MEFKDLGKSVYFRLGDLRFRVVYACLVPFGFALGFITGIFLQILGIAWWLGIGTALGYVAAKVTEVPYSKTLLFNPIKERSLEW